MSALQVTVLGTGTSQGVPVIGCECRVCKSEDVHDKRLRSAVTLTDGQTRINIDMGPDFRQQMLRARFAHTDAILLTHEHNDHVTGMDDVRPINFRSRKHMPVYGLPRTLGEVRKRFPYAFDDDADYPGRPRIDLIAIDSEAFTIGDIVVRPVKVMHGPLPILGFRIGDFAYITDCKTIPDDQLPQLSGLKVLILNALHRRQHFSHLNLQEAIDLAQRIRPEQTFLTHISHDMGLHEEVNHELPEGIALAYDMQEIRI